jgi:cytochrome P450
LSGPGSVAASRARASESELSLLQLLKPAVLADPYPFYRKLREADPVHWDPFLHSWVVTRYADAVTVLTRSRAARTPSPERMRELGLQELAPYAAMMMQQILFMDPPDHTRIRSVCAAAFTPGRIAGLEQDIRQHADALIDEAAPRGRMDLLADFASRYTGLVLCQMLGLPPGNHNQLRRWAAEFGELVGNFEHDPETMDERAESLRQFKAYIAEQVIEQTAHPREGLISRLLAADVHGVRLSFDEIVANTLLMVGGGIEETANLIANGMASLLLHPEQLGRLIAEPEILPSAIEELLRFESTTQYTGRIAAEEMSMGGRLIQKGDAIIVVLAAANRDPARFADPERLDLTRADNRHVAFSWAAHYCLGAPLVRMAAKIAFSSLLRRLPGLSLETDRLTWRAMAAMRAIRALPVRFAAVSAAGTGRPPAASERA